MTLRAEPEKPSLFLVPHGAACIGAGCGSLRGIIDEALEGHG